MTGVAVGALAGVRVVELASEQCAFAGKILADLGAEVILVEPHGGHAVPSLRSLPGRCPGSRTELVVVVLQHRQVRRHPRPR